MPPRLDARLTYGEYRRFPADGRRHELIGGSHVVTPAPSTWHQAVSGQLYVQLFEQLQRTRRALVFYAPTDLQLSEHDIVQPDLLVVMDDRRHVVTPSRIVGAPDLVVEIVSPASRDQDSGPKLELYRSAGVREYWIVEPEEQELRQYVLEGAGYRLAGTHADGFRAVAIPALTIDLLEIWRQRLQNPSASEGG